jgi:hypothetical protein
LGISIINTSSIVSDSPLNSHKITKKQKKFSYIFKIVLISLSKKRETKANDRLDQPLPPHKENKLYLKA